MGSGGAYHARVDLDASAGWLAAAADRFDPWPRVRLATLPTALEAAPPRPGGSRLWVKRDDLTGLAAGGNKVRKLEWLCGEALAAGADTLVTVGAAQSNHCRMTAAAGAVLGLETHLVVSGSAPDPGDDLTGNQRLSRLLGAQLHHTGADAHHWGVLEIAREELTAQLHAQGRRPFSIPIGGSTATGALGYAWAMLELLDQCALAGLAPGAIVVTSSSGGTHAGLIAGSLLARHLGAEVPPVIAVGVAPGVMSPASPVAELAHATAGLLGLTATRAEIDDLVITEDGFMGPGYAVATPEGDAALLAAARQGGWILDRTYTAKGFAGMEAIADRLRAATDGDSSVDVVWIHTGGLPAVFTPGGLP